MPLMQQITRVLNMTNNKNETTTSTQLSQQQPQQVEVTTNSEIASNPDFNDFSNFQPPADSSLYE